MKIQTALEVGRSKKSVSQASLELFDRIAHLSAVLARNKSPHRQARANYSPVSTPATA
jgi:hypothetical protein